jgi:hypothetical protein
MALISAEIPGCVRCPSLRCFGTIAAVLAGNTTTGTCLRETLKVAGGCRGLLMLDQVLDRLSRPLHPLTFMVNRRCRALGRLIHNPAVRLPFLLCQSSRLLLRMSSKGHMVSCLPTHLCLQSLSVSFQPRYLLSIGPLPWLNIRSICQLRIPFLFTGQLLQLSIVLHRFSTHLRRLVIRYIPSPGIIRLSLRLSLPPTLQFSHPQIQCPLQFSHLRT